MGKLHQTYRLTITTLTPLHIGTGRTLQRDFDYVTYRNRTWVIDTDALAAVLYDESPGEFDRMIAGIPAAQLLRDSDYREDSPLFRYVMPGQPRSGRAGAELQEQIKDPWDRPYIPGSSLKGALRTALMYAIWNYENLPFNPNELDDRRAKFAAQPLERKVLVSPKVPNKGKSPNYDLLRALQVSDSTPDAKKRLQVTNVQVITGHKQGSPIEIEAIPPDVTFTATLTLDGYLLRSETIRELGWDEKKQIRYLKVLPKIVNLWTRHRLANENWRTRAGQWGSTFKRLVDFYTRDQLAPNEFILQLGWGGGWDSKTLGKILTKDPGKFATVVERYERQMDRQRSFKQGDHFPRSRRVVVGRAGNPIAPPGWIKVRMEEIT